MFQTGACVSKVLQARRLEAEILQGRTIDVVIVLIQEYFIKIFFLKLNILT